MNKKVGMMTNNNVKIKNDSLPHIVLPPLLISTSSLLCFQPYLTASFNFSPIVCVILIFVDWVIGG
jgi:membrane protein CcdC involved in cytochrome C biogenesis